MKTIIRNTAFYLTIALLSITGCKTIEFESALIYINQVGNLDKGIEYLRKSLKKVPADVETYILLGQVYGMKGDFVKMDNALDSALLFISDSIESHKYLKEDIEYIKDDFWCGAFNQGIENFENNHFADAGINFNNCIIIDDKRPEAYINLGLTEEKINDFPAAIEHYRKAYDLDHANTDLMFYVAELYNNANQFENTIKLMDLLISHEPKLTEAVIQKAIAYDYLGDTKKAISEYRKALSVQPTETDLLFNLGRIYYFGGMYFDAIDNFEKVLKQNPDDIETIIFMGDSYFSLGEDIVIKIQESGEADSTYLTDIELQEYENQAITYFESAILFLEQAVAKDVNDPDVWNMLAIAYSNLGLTEKAKEIFDKEKESLEK